MLPFIIAPVFAADLPGPHAAQVRQFHSISPRAYTPPPPGAPPAITVYGYHAYWTGSPLDLDFSRLTHLAIFNVDLNSDGTLSDTHRWTDVAGEVVPLAHSHGVKVHLCMTSFTDADTNSVLSSATRRTTAIAELKSLVDEYGADGVNVDIEGLDASQRENMNAFIQELGMVVDEIYIAMPAINWSDAFDYAFLADNSDGLFIMGYGYHWSGGDPGPVAPLYGGDPWSQYSLEWTVADYITNGVPADKIILGLPLYGRRWPTSGPEVPGTATDSGVAVIMEDAMDEALEQGSLYDEVTHTPYILENTSQLWYDDVASVRDRIAYAVEEDLQGVGFWALQYEGDPELFWDMVSEETGQPNGNGNGNGGGGGSDTTPPVALAGLPILAYPGDTVTLDGSPSYDEDGQIVRYAWEQVSGPAVTLEEANTARPRMYVPSPGQYELALTVTDNGQATDTDVVTVIAADPAAGRRYGGCASAPLWGGVWLSGLLVVFRRRRSDG